MSKITKYALSDLYDMSSGISSKKEQAGHGAPFVSFGTVFNNYFLPEELPDLMDTNEKEQQIYSIKTGDVLITRTSETIDELAMSCVAVKDYPMPIEQLQKLLGHQRIDTTLQYAMVKQSNVKFAHRKYIG